MAEVWFYHLERRALEQVLPGMVEKSLERGWNAVIEAPGEERVAALDTLLWTWSDESFVPHGTARDGEPERQPVYLTAGTENPNRAKVRFCVDGADPSAALAADASYDRVAVLFDGNDDEAVALARRQWSALKGTTHDRAYWQADGNGRWAKKG